MPLRILILVMLAFAALPARAQDAAYSFLDILAQCETVGEGLDAGTVPSFTEDGCTTPAPGGPDPQGTFLWLKGTVDIPESMLNGPQPLAIMISGKASSVFYINGKRVGQNGTPALHARHEIPGRIDAVIPLPKGLLHAGQNDVKIAMSAHHGFLTLPRPIAVMAIGPYQNPTDYALHLYLPSLPLLGLLIAGTLYFGVLALRHRTNWLVLLPPMAALFATCQMVAEVSRGYIPYAYPLHDLRLLAIVLFALMGGVCLLMHVVARFASGRKIGLMLGGAAATLAVVYFVPSYDGKAALALMVPAAFSALLAAVAAARRKTSALAYTIALAVATAAIFLTASDFLDVYFYYVVAAILAFLFAGQLRDFATMRQQAASEQARADRLALALEEARQKASPGALSVKSAGGMDMVSTDKLVFCQGARDYVELKLEGGDTKLHSASLTELEAELPATFLRVHRSYIVNTAFIDRLEREASGSGQLHLSTGDTVPVSRRIMPSVRKALA